MPNLRFSVSHTTRLRRPGEEDGKNYYFVSPETFQDYIDKGLMAEWTEIYGNRYGTAQQTIRQAFESGCDVLFDIDERGGRQLSESYPDAVTILILPPSLAVLRQRLMGRGTESEESLRTRLQRVREEIKLMGWYAYVIVNDSFEEAVSRLTAIIAAERCRHDRSPVEALLHE